MKKIFAGLITLFAFVNIGRSQNYYCSVYPDQNGEVELYLLNICGSEIQWQVRDTSSTEWIDIVGGTTNPFLYEATQQNIEGKEFQARVTLNPDTIPKYSHPFGIKLINSILDISIGDMNNGSFVYYSTNDTILGAIYIDKLQAPWGCYEQDIQGAESTEIGAGLQNTIDILTTCEQENTASEICNNFVTGGYDDWYLPSIEELELILLTLKENKIQQIQSQLYGKNDLGSDFFGKNKNIVRSKDYWSSSELSSTHARSTLIYEGEVIDWYNGQKFRHLNIVASRWINSNDIYDNRCSAIIFPFQFTNHISVIPVDNKSTNVWVEYIGDDYDEIDYSWDFGNGTVISGEGKGPYEVEYIYGGYNRVSMNFRNDDCGSPNFFSKWFQVDLIEDIKAHFPEVYGGITRAVDFNNDNLTDVFISGSDTTALYQNFGQNIFTIVETNFPNLTASYCSWGDYDNDGFSDIILSGFTPIDSIPSTFLFKNLGNSEFMEMSNNLSDLANGFIEWIDYDNDGILDIIISGEDINKIETTKLYKGNGSPLFSEVETDLPNLTKSSVAIDDYNRDNYQDLILLGSKDTMRMSSIFKNNEGQFEELNVEITDVNNGDAAWEDFNNDGYLDVFISGNEDDMVIEITDNVLDVYAGKMIAVAKIYNYDGNDIFSFSSNPTDPTNSFIDVPDARGFTRSSVETGDFDNDGWSDIAITGMPPVTWVAVGVGGNDAPPVDYRSMPSIFLNTSENIFENIEANIPATWTGNTMDHIIMSSFESSNISFADFNNDGSLDILREGRKQDSRSAIYLNELDKNNSAPQVPENLNVVIACDSILLLWGASSDDYTPEANLTYEFYLGTSPNSGDIFSKKNIRKLRSTFFKLDILPDGIYYWSVKAVDNAKSSSEYAPEQSFEIDCTTAIDDLYSDYNVLIYPNPFADKFSISVEGTSKQVHYTITNHKGEVLRSGVFRETIEINSDLWPSGVYYLNFTIDNKTTTKKIIHSN